MCTVCNLKYYQENTIFGAATVRPQATPRCSLILTKQSRSHSDYLNYPSLTSLLVTNLIYHIFYILGKFHFPLSVSSAVRARAGAWCICSTPAWSRPDWLFD